MTLDSEHCWKAVETGDSRFDGWFFCGVTSTGIYCRPSCPAHTPQGQGRSSSIARASSERGLPRENVRFFATSAAAQGGGFRACKRCRPDATPGSPEWDLRTDLVGRAMRLIADGVVDREGVTGLAARLGYSERHVHRQLVAVVGAGPLALARAQRAQSARILLETTGLPAIEVAFAAGFQSVRQFNATVKEIFAGTPTQLRRGAQLGNGRLQEAGTVELRLPYRAPLDAARLIDFLAKRAVPGVEEGIDGAYRRSLRLPHGAGVVELRPVERHVRGRFTLDDLRDLAAAVQRCRALLDLDSDPAMVTDALGGDEVIGPLVSAAPGLRLPGHVDAHELAARAVIGQQVSVSGAATLAARLVTAHGEPLERPQGAVTHLFPTAGAVAGADRTTMAMPASRRDALTGLARALARGDVVLDPGADRDEAQQRLLALPGIGPWTATYIAMRALRDPDAFLAGDLGVRHALERLGHDGRPGAAIALAERWRPYRAYAVQHLWATLGSPRAQRQPVTA